MSKTKKIKPLEDYGTITDAAVVSRGNAVATAITGNPNFPNPPVDPAALKAAVGNLSTLMTEALDGSKKVMAEKKKQREAVVKMLRLLGRYVEVMSKDDLAIFKSSGFEPAPSGRTSPKQVSQHIRKIDHGALGGQVSVQLKGDPQARSHDLRFGPLGAGGAPPSNWTTETITSVKTPVIVKGLTPGTMYAFQVRTLTKAGYSDWSDSVTFMCT